MLKLAIIYSVIVNFLVLIIGAHIAFEREEINHSWLKSLLYLMLFAILGSIVALLSVLIYS